MTSDREAFPGSSCQGLLAWHFGIPEVLSSECRRVHLDYHYGIIGPKNHTVYGLSALIAYWHCIWTLWECVKVVLQASHLK